MNYEYERYLCTKETLKETIEKYGVGIISNVIDLNEINKMNSGVWDYLEKISENFDIPIQRDDEKSWKSFYKLLPLHSMLMQHFNIGHAQYVWDLRQNPKVVEIFAKLWNVSSYDLLVSFDGASFHLPPEKTKRGWYRGSKWLHVDQSYTRNNFECVQSWITGYDVEDGDATLTFLEGSNKHHQHFKEKYMIEEKEDWYKLNEEEYKYYIDKGCEQKYIKCPAGSMVFWDSRTVHSGTEPTKERKKSNFRNVVYICMVPRNRADKTNIEKKKKAFNEMRTTTHYPHKIKLFTKWPRTYGAELPDITQISKPILTDLGKRLAGI